jgi:hypothetical protein
MDKQRGITLIGMLLSMAVVFMAVVVLMRVVPVVVQHYSIVTSIEALKDTPSSSLTGDPVTDVSILRYGLSKRLNINSIDDLKPEQLVITPEGPNTFQMHLKYQVVRPLVYNVGLIFNFDRTIEVVIGSEK